jgi:hypothetical protein
MVWLAERFQAPYLTGCATTTNGMIIMDKTSQEDDRELTRSFEFDLLYGTRFHKLPNICLNLLSADSNVTPGLEIADLVIGIVVSWLGGGKYSDPLFPLLFQQFLRADHSPKTKILAAAPSSIITGYGLKLFPKELQRMARDRFKELDAGYNYSTADGFVAEKSASDLEEVPF